MKVYLFRHAQTDSNILKVIQGTLNTPLNNHGHHQASLLARRFQAIKPSENQIFCSDLDRCKETLAHVLRERPSPIDLDDVVYTPLLQERYMAELQGVSKDLVEKLCREQSKTKWEFGEGSPALIARTARFWQEHVLPLYADRDSDDVAMICSHGGTLLALTGSLVTTFGFKASDELPLHAASPNTGVTLLDTRTMTVELYADASHLKVEGVEAYNKDKNMENVDV
ncbi:histidine phosphatase superfamily [Protomyces lactucae-debilis]|uniref:Histidine phosphatase superfamily n=1 Tax=Protomyces lactucae-debilis TaxID=2754530 RepID=A0A1Y2FAG0_PROLT|nr:histidine phosphatase superfamily [Protomyces lactucae-debilis]ORY80434.1 histidine phosphatase superfamily [Protomyces lactucae-debilis]